MPAERVAEAVAVRYEEKGEKREECGADAGDFAGGGGPAGGWWGIVP